MLPQSVQLLIDEFNKLPSVGKKMASKIVLYLLKQPQEDIEKFSNLLLNVKKNLFLCNICQNYCEEELCDICKKPNRNKDIICLVESPLDIIPIEKSGVYNGVYHVLHGVLSPINSIGPDDITVWKLIDRLNNDDVKELIIALNPNIDSEATVSYITRYLTNKNILITKLSIGIPIGSYIEYVDEVTLRQAIKNRITH